MHRFTGLGLVILAVLAVDLPASADEQLLPLASSGNWAAVAHKTSITAAPDTCIVMNVVDNVLFRADEDDMEFRVFNSKWSLPAHVAGDVSVSIGSLNKTYDVSSNTDTGIDVVLSSDEVTNLFAAMDKAASMTVTVGKAKPIVVSLAGSTKATNAFRTCAGIKGNVASPGSNPFQ